MECQEAPSLRLRQMLDRVGYTDRDRATVAEVRDVFVRRRDEFGRFFFDYFWQMPRTRLILEHTSPNRRLESIMAQWFEDLFSSDLDERFIKKLWRSGMKHTQINVDQRFISLGYSLVRNFCRDVIDRELPVERRLDTVVAVDKMLDFCVIAATDSFVSCTSRCDRDMIAGIAHQIRNPITIIGGVARRLEKELADCEAAEKSHSMLAAQNKRLEHMATDINQYVALFEREPSPKPVDIHQSIDRALARLEKVRSLDGVDIQVDPHPDAVEVLADPEELPALLYHVLDNAVDALNPDDRRIRITSHPAGSPGFMELTVQNTGQAPQADQMDELFTPFHSLKPEGTGFGLPIANTIAHRNMGALTLESGGDLGIQCRISLPAVTPIS